MVYHLTGLVSAAIFLLSICGLWAQLSLLRQRRHLDESDRKASGPPTAVLSLNQFTSSFLAFFSFFLYGSCLERFNHYLVWPRLAASILTLAVIFEIVRDRRDRLATAVFVTCATLLTGVPVLLAIVPAATNWGRTVSQSLIVGITILLAQGNLHQVLLIRQTGRTGGVSLRLHQLFFWKDVSTISFAVAMGAFVGWPLLLLSTVSATTKLLTLWQFRWARISPLAQQRREATPPPNNRPPALIDAS